MYLWTSVSILGVAMIAGIVIGIQHLRNQQVGNQPALFHGIGAILGTTLVLGYLSFARSWNIGYLREAIASSLVMAGLVGCLLGLLRLADQEFPWLLLMVHVGFGLLGTALIGWFLLA